MTTPEQMWSMFGVYPPENGLRAWVDQPGPPGPPWMSSSDLALRTPPPDPLLSAPMGMVPYRGQEVPQPPQPPQPQRPVMGPPSPTAGDMPKKKKKASRGDNVLGAIAQILPIILAAQHGRMGDYTQSLYKVNEAEQEQARQDAALRMSQENKLRDDAFAREQLGVQSAHYKALEDISQQNSIQDLLGRVLTVFGNQYQWSPDAAGAYTPIVQSTAEKAGLNGLDTSKFPQDAVGKQDKLGADIGKVEADTKRITAQAKTIDAERDGRVKAILAKASKDSEDAKTKAVMRQVEVEYKRADARLKEAMVKFTNGRANLTAAQIAQGWAKIKETERHNFASEKNFADRTAATAEGSAIDYKLGAPANNIRAAMTALNPKFADIPLPQVLSVAQRLRDKGFIDWAQYATDVYGDKTRPIATFGFKYGNMGLPIGGETAAQQYVNQAADWAFRTYGPNGTGEHSVAPAPPQGGGRQLGNTAKPPQDSVLPVQKDTYVYTITDPKTGKVYKWYGDTPDAAEAKARNAANAANWKIAGLNYDPNAVKPEKPEDKAPPKAPPSKPAPKTNVRKPAAPASTPGGRRRYSADQF